MRDTTQTPLLKGLKTLLNAVKGKEKDFTQGSIRWAIFMLAVPMILEMLMESLFAVVDIFYVGKISVTAVATVALIESVMMIVFAIAIGLSISATATVARRIGEKKPEAAAEAAFQTLVIAICASIVFSAVGILFAKEILQLMGGEPTLVEEGRSYTMIILGGNVTVMLLFLINAIFRGAGDATLAMRALILANGLNLLLDPIFIFGFGPVPAMGLEGAAIATTMGRAIGVIYQVYILTGATSKIRIIWAKVRINIHLIGQLIKMSLGGIGQFMIGTLSWLFLVKISAAFGSEVLAGYAIAFRIIMFTILPSWGLSNAAATLVGQNLGAGQPDRAEASVWKCARYNVIFLGAVSIVFIVGAEFFVALFSDNAEAVHYGALALRYICCGYVFFAYGMVIGQAFNGAGDVKTPTLLNFICYWILEVPLAYLLAKPLGMGPKGIFIAIAASISILAVISILVFKRGKWKTVKV